MTAKNVISYIVSAASLLSLWSCAADSSYMPVSPGNEGGVRFMAATAELGQGQGQDRGTQDVGITTTRNIREFKVSAVYKGQYNIITLLDNVVVRRVGLTNKWEYSPAVDWPGPPVNFFMVSPANTDWHVKNYGDGREAVISRYTNDGKTDLLAAADYDMIEHPGPVKVNFRHTLARVEASMRSLLPEDYYLVVKMVYLTGVPLEGPYTWPTQSTDVQNTSDTGSPEVSGKWETTGYVSHSNFTYTIFGSPDPGNDGNIFRNTGGSYLSLKGIGVQFMIPGRLMESRYDEAHWLGANLMVVYRIAETGTDRTVWPAPGVTRDEYLFNNDKTWAQMPFPLREATPGNEWLSGIDYHYRLTFRMPDSFSTETRAGRARHAASISPVSASIEVTSAPY